MRELRKWGTDQASNEPPSDDEGTVVDVALLTMERNELETNGAAAILVAETAARAAAILVAETAARAAAAATAAKHVADEALAVAIAAAAAAAFDALEIPEVAEAAAIAVTHANAAAAAAACVEAATLAAAETARASQLVFQLPRARIFLPLQAGTRRDCIVAGLASHAAINNDTRKGFWWVFFIF